MSSAEEIKTEYMSSLADLKFNSKPLINVLTMLAEENSPNAEVIVEAIETHLSKVSADVKLPVLYLIDCIMKNVGGTYTNLFSKNIVSTFCGVFGMVDEKTRAEMFKLRQTWNDVFPQMKLYAIDVQIAHLDPAWPVTAKAPPNSIHFNPKFLKTKTPVPAMMAPMVVPPPTGALDKQTLLMQEELIQKQKELLELKQRKLELEVLQTKVKLQEQIKNNPPITQNILLKPEVAKQLVPNLKPKTTIAMPLAQQTKTTNVINNSSRSQTVNTATKPIRDPRLLRQQQQQQKQQQQQPKISDNQLGQKTANLDNNKIVTNNKTNGRKPRKDPRLVINKDDKTPISKPDTIKPNPIKSNNSESKHPKPKCNSSGGLDKAKRASPTRHKKRHKGDKSDEPAAFKGGAKGLAKGRNYVRRNLSSPDEAPQSPKAAVTHDEDLRGFAAPPQKQARLQEVPAPPTGLESKNGNVDCSVKDKDIDLRHLPAIITRKRVSADSPESGAAKKSKSEMMDRLFGAKDTDLRQLPQVSVKEKPSTAGERDVVQLDPVEATKLPRSDFSRPVVVVVEDRPPTPPPPIISNSPSKRDSTKNDLDIVRAKLANATNKMSKTIPKKPMEDRDLRLISDSDATHKVIISKEDEHKIRSGDMTKEQEADLLKKIIMQIEINKLNEAKKKEKSVSDDELSDGDDKKQKTTQESGIIPFKDKDERLNVKSMQTRAQTGAEFFSTFGRDLRRFPGPQAWRGARGAGAGPRWGGPVWENQSRPRGWTPPPPPPSNWRNTPTNYPHLEDETVSAGSQDVSSESPSLPNGLVNQNEIKTIAIDGSQKDIRFYDETAVVFLNWDDPREISFLDSKGRRVVFNDDVECFLEFGEPYKDVVINGSVHKVRLGAPSREIYIDYVPYECYFGSPGIRIELNGTGVTVKLDGPPPQVKIGEVKRCDLVAGKVTLFVDAKVMMPIFLDAKPQQFIVNGKMCTLKFVNALKTVIINDKAFDVEYGGLPKPVMIYGKKRFIRFSVLPRGIRPGRVKIKDMEGGSLSPMHADENSQDGSPSYFDPTEPALPIIGRTKRRNVADSPDRNSNSPNAYQNMLEQQSLNNLDLLTPSLGPVSAAGGYQLDNTPQGDEPQSNKLPNVAAPSLPNALNINELFQKLVSSGFITTGPKDDQTERIETIDEQQSKAKRNVCANLKLITFERPETLKVRQAALYTHLYAGMQCSSCGMRFSPEASMLYSQHLDWHFRQNRKGKRNTRVAASRKWFYSLSDWKNYEELEDMEEREKNYFDQQQQSEGGNDDADEDIDLPSVPADPDSTDECCEMCRDKFDQFFNEEKEEWHLENAIRVEEKTYHPVCYEDYQKSLLDTQPEDSKLEQPAIEEEKKEEQIPGLEIVIDDDDEEEVKASNDDDEPYEPGDIVSLGSDESKPNDPEEKQSEEVEGEQKKNEDEDDDDVILNEVAPIKIVVDDDEDGEDAIGKDKQEGEEEQTVFQIKDEKPDDGFMEVAGLVSLPNGGQIKIKAEPIDPDDMAPETTPPLVNRPPAEAETEDSFPAHTELVPSIDGNIDLVTSASTTGATTVVSANKIKINISKPLPVIHNKEKESAPDSGFPSETYIDPSEPFPPGEEPEQLRPSKLKPALEGVDLRRLPPIKRGSELTGLCSIM